MSEAERTTTEVKRINGPMNKSAQTLVSSLKFAFSNFGPLIVFYASNHYFGLRAAILASVLFSIAEISFKLVKKQPISRLFLFSAGMTLIFGCVDLYLKQSVLFKFEPAISNLLTGLFFASTLFGEKTVLHEYYERQKNSKPLTLDRVAYIRYLTVVWVLYFFAKAVAYLWMASRFTVEQGLVIRTVVGSGSLYALLAISIFGSKRIFPLLKKWRMLPVLEGVEK